MEINETIVADIVRRVVAEQLGQSQNEKFAKTIDRASGVAVIKTATVKPEKFDTGKDGDKVYLLDTLTLEESPRSVQVLWRWRSPVLTGLLSMTKSTMSLKGHWRLSLATERL